MSIANAVPSKHHLSQLQLGQEPLASKNSPPANVGGLDDFLNELNQATNLRLQVQEEAATDSRLKNKKTPENKDSKTESDLQILQNQDANTQNPANIADLNARSNPATAKIMAALEQLTQRNQIKAASLLSNWGDTSMDQSGLKQQALMAQGIQNSNLDFEMLRANLKNLGLENMLGELQSAKAAGNQEQVASIEAQLAQKLLAQLAGLNSLNHEVQTNQTPLNSLSAKASIDAKTLQALEAQRNQIAANQTINQALQKQLLAEQQINRLAGSDSVKVVSVEPSLAQELKMKQAAQLDAEFTLAHTTLLGSNTVDKAILNQATSAVVENMDIGGNTQNLLTGLLMDGQASLQIDQKVDKSLADDLNGQLLSASQVAQSGTSVSTTPTQIAMSLHEASITSGPLHSEIISAAKSGGGRIQLELTPPEQGTLRIDLRIDQSGRAHLIVEGANDAAKARLDQGGQQLKNEFAQMGLNLSLDLRQGDSRFAQNQQFGSDQPRFAQPSFSTDRSSMGIGLLSEKLATTRLFSDNASGVSGIHLYA